MPLCRCGRNCCARCGKLRGSQSRTGLASASVPRPWLRSPCRTVAQPLLIGGVWQNKKATIRHSSPSPAMPGRLARGAGARPCAAWNCPDCSAAGVAPGRGCCCGTFGTRPAGSQGSTLSGVWPRWATAGTTMLPVTGVRPAAHYLTSFDRSACERQQRAADLLHAGAETPCYCKAGPSMRAGIVGSGHALDRHSAGRNVGRDQHLFVPRRGRGSVGARRERPHQQRGTLGQRLSHAAPAAAPRIGQA